MKIKRSTLLLFAIVGAIFSIWLAPLSMSAQSVSAANLDPAEVIDDFEVGDALDWGFFGGNAAGGGGGVFDDRPKQGAYYLSTGWGGNGTNSGFYGGAYKNFDDGAQVTPPAEPWFNIWVLNQSNATVDQYTLEITIREDLDGNGWTNGVEDSFRLDTTFANAVFDDRWRLVSAPLSDFTDLFTGGDGIFNGNLDEIVLVISGVQGGDGTTVEVDFDLIAFSSEGPMLPLVFDDMEHGSPFANGWFAFGGSVGGGGIDPNTSDLPPSNGGSFSLQTGWGSGGVPGYFGGFGRTYPVDLWGADHFNFWINPDAGQDYVLEINLQEDDNGDDAANPADDDEFQFNCNVGPSGPCAVAGGGWQWVSIPLADFLDDNSYFFGGNGVLDAVSVANGGNGQLINIVVAVISNSGADVTFRTDYWLFSDGKVVDDFENGPADALPCPPDQLPLGFCTFSDPDSDVAITTTDSPPAAVPGAASGNHVLQVDTDVNDSFGFAGVTHGFANLAGDAPAPQDWSGYEGFRLWLYGNDTGKTLFIDVLDNVAPGSTTDTAERFSIDIVDDFSGWQFFEIPFSEFARKEVGNGAPNDGFGRTEVHGWAFGVFNAGIPFINYLDAVGVYGVAEVPELAVTFAANNFDVPEGTTGEIVVELNRPMNEDDPAQVSVDYAVEPGTANPERDYLPTAGTLTFVNGGTTEHSFQLQTFDDGKYSPDKRVILRLSNPQDVELGFVIQASGTIVNATDYDPNLLDDFESYPYLWTFDDALVVGNPEYAAGDPFALPGQGAYERVLELRAPELDTAVIQGRLCNQGNGVIPVQVLTTDDFDATTINHSTVMLGNAYEAHTKKKTGEPIRHEQDVDRDGDIDLVFHFRVSETGLECDATDVPVTGWTFGATAGARFGRDFALGQDWSGSDGLSFWYYGQDSNDTITVELLDNRAPDPGPASWSLVWSDEFDDPAGTLPNPAKWGYELGDGTLNGIPGWGNDELQYYTDSADNAATDGLGNLVITAREADGTLPCYYGPCEYTSARLASKYTAEFAYGRIESRVLVPDGDAGLWPAFWSLGTDIDRVGWPQTGEIDIMEYVSKLPEEIFGTIHGPGYSGGEAFGDTYVFPGGVAGAYHTFAIEWQPNLIEWYVDDILYLTATPANVAPNEWVFNDPVYLLLNMAIGGNFGGPVSDDTTFPQEMKVDYVHIYQGPDTAERFESSFTDDFVGWQEVYLPYDGFTRSSEQPTGAPDDGLGLEEIWGYGFAPADDLSSGYLLIDQTRLIPTPLPTEITVTNLNDNGEGSLRYALANVASGGTITFDPGLAAGTISLLSGELVVDRPVAVDGSGAPRLIVSGNKLSRVFQIAAGVEIFMSDLTIADGVGAPQGGGIRNLGTLNLDRVTVTDNTESSLDGPWYENGGGGIYNGDGATLNLTDSTVSNNATLSQPAGGIYGFFNSTINISRSTVSGNVAADVAGGLRSLGDVNITNSTFSGNVSTAWHGGAIFHTDGQLTVLNSTFALNTAPAGTAAGIVVAGYSADANMTITNSIVAGNLVGFDCAIIIAGANASITSGGYNIDGDGSCNLIVVTDQPNTDPMLGPLFANGGPTETHAPVPGSPAIDKIDPASCPATDQRGVSRPQGPACDIGSFELEP